MSATETRPPQELNRRTRSNEIVHTLTKLNELRGMAFDVTAEARAALQIELDSLVETAEESEARRADEHRAHRIAVQRSKNSKDKRERKRLGRVRRLVHFALNVQYANLSTDAKAYWGRIESQVTDPATKGKDLDHGLNRAALLHQIGLGESLDRFRMRGSRALLMTGEEMLAFLDLPRKEQIALGDVQSTLYAHRIGSGL